VLSVDWTPAVGGGWGLAGGAFIGALNAGLLDRVYCVPTVVFCGNCDTEDEDQLLSSG
jgi:hypothetical protein